MEFEREALFEEQYRIFKKYVSNLNHTQIISAIYRFDQYVDEYGSGNEYQYFWLIVMEAKGKLDASMYRRTMECYEIDQDDIDTVLDFINGSYKDLDEVLEGLANNFYGKISLEELEKDEKRKKEEKEREFLIQMSLLKPEVDKSPGSVNDL